MWHSVIAKFFRGPSSLDTEKAAKAGARPKKRAKIFSSSAFFFTQVSRSKRNSFCDKRQLTQYHKSSCEKESHRLFKLCKFVFQNQPNISIFQNIAVWGQNLCKKWRTKFLNWTMAKLKSSAKLRKTLQWYISFWHFWG